MPRVVVIGLGIFGYNVVKNLFEGGMDVIAIDKNKDAVQKVRDYSSRAIVADGIDKSVMDSIGIGADDVVILSFGEDLAASTLATLHLKQLGVRNIIVKAPNEEHKLVLEKVGATEVIIPEKEMANKLARGFISPNLIDYIPLSDDYMICETAPPKQFIGKSLRDVHMRSKHHVDVIAIRDTLTDNVHMVQPDYLMKDSDILVVIGKSDDIDKLK
ncbi:MAG TPA: TrkA family potassium uptake protein [Syntrophorhabdus sp.]|jgi:trk system potassium uptake protein TrkA|nr:TrkA family potassium uptake protein [Syntrophorhabdus sp.]MDI9556833.1 TrkA family potassium uptake protein [Pseudomonadota bacterium]OPX97369.1 MAG: Ktr system potassium uptake protein A [Syntrophorhabdus sp. PtaB.Bin027]OQB76212.1 MAG: Ktr system potassium uptake protein A [Deltaproteobacteria bacterium ADurb.Bin135]MBP8744033.1 TrkA family potassium uptake protein [Syntrophorhabdus sp.]